MNRHMLIVANAFYVVAGALALPSIPGFLYFGWAALRLFMLGPTASAAPAASPDSLIRYFELGARAFGAIFRVLGEAGQFVITSVAAVFFVVLLMAGGLFATARGLHAHHGWARAMAILFLLVTLLASLVGMMAVRRGLGLLFASLAAASLYAIWVLLRRFA